MESVEAIVRSVNGNRTPNRNGDPIAFGFTLEGEYLAESADVVPLLTCLFFEVFVSGFETGAVDAGFDGFVLDVAVVE